jgi:hypothetical protein
VDVSVGQRPPNPHEQLPGERDHPSATHRTAPPEVTPVDRPRRMPDAALDRWL